MILNPHDRDWTKHRFVLWFGACGTTRILVWANGLEDALDECVDWLAENAPGHLCDDMVKEEYGSAIADGHTEEEAIAEAEADTTLCDGGHYLLSYEWGIHCEDPSREDILQLQGRL